MSEDDQELERLKAKRLAEMQRNISTKSQLDTPPSQTKPKPNPRDIVVSKLGYRGLEVLENAEKQFPNETKMIIEKIAELLSSGEINEILDGGKLLLLFRSVGLNIRMDTKINVEQDGKFVSLSDKLSSKTKSED
ncbi:MAG: double-stranded DNA-binding protein [Nitrosopumilaceae archaeon]|nr:double-stranded DNA-binding protein [Nitrosopumilaceae archaeon]